MHANLVVIGSHGDVLPFVAIGVELRRRGFSVTLASAEPFEPLCRRQGLGFESLATTAEFDSLISHADLWHPVLGLPRLLDAGMQMLQPAFDFVARNHPIAVTFGSAMLHAGDLYDRFIDLGRTTGRRIVIVTPSPRPVPPTVAARVAQVRYAPFSLLLPRCAAIAHHGGIGTVAQAAAAGTPQLILPFAFDHFDEAVRVRRLGIGTSLKRSHATGPRLHAALQALEAPAVRSQCAAVAARMRGRDGTNGACDVIERALARHLGSQPPPRLEQPGDAAPGLFSRR